MDNITINNGNLLIEFFSEEIPAGMQVQSGINLENRFNFFNCSIFLIFLYF